MVKHGLLVTLALLVITLPAAPRAQTGTPPLSDEAITQFLLKARVVRSRGTEKGITGSVRATLDDGTLRHDAHVQTIDQSKAEFRGTQSTELNFRDSWRFNIAAYRIDRLLSLNLVPVSVERRWRNDAGAFTWWIDDVMMDEGERVKKNVGAPDAACWSEQLHAMRLFDQLIDNVDRNVGNMLITSEWRLWAIDHTRAFRYSKTPRKPEHLVRIDRAVLQRLKALDLATLKREIGRYVVESDIRTLLSRRDAIVAHFENRGDAALFDRRDPAAGCAKVSASPGRPQPHQAEQQHDIGRHRMPSEERDVSNR
jgi:hypothetical protein